MARPTRRQQIDALIMLPQRANIVEDIIEVADPETPGKILLRKQGRRADNVFESIFVSGRIDSETRHAAHQLCEVFAKSKGVFNVSERSMERVQYETSDLHQQMMIRASYAMQYHEIMDRLESIDNKLIAALVKDFVLGDGAADTDDGIRWRQVVRETCTAHSIPCRITYEGAPVAHALRDLPWATIDYRKMASRLMDERRKIAEREIVA